MTSIGFIYYSYRIFVIPDKFLQTIMVNRAEPVADFGVSCTWTGSVE